MKKSIDIKVSELKTEISKLKRELSNIRKIVSSKQNRQITFKINPKRALERLGTDYLNSHKVPQLIKADINRRSGSDLGMIIDIKNINAESRII